MTTTAPTVASVDWAVIANIGVALATLALAGMTFLAVRVGQHQAATALRQVEVSEHQTDQMRQQVAAAHRQLEIARDTLAAQQRPLLIDVAWGTMEPRHIQFGSIVDRDPGSKVLSSPVKTEVSEASDPVLISVPLRNVGTGIAMIGGLGLSPPGPVSGEISQPNVPPGEMTKLSFSVPADLELAEAIRNGAFTVEVRYTDLAGQSDTVTTAHVRRRGGPFPWFVSQLHHRRPDEDEPFSASGPASPDM